MINIGAATAEAKIESRMKITQQFGWNVNSYCSRLPHTSYHITKNGIKKRKDRVYRENC